MSRAVIVGAGPAGLMAAEMLARAGHDVTVADAKPSFGRKFLMAGKSGLNLTKADPLAQLKTAYDTQHLHPILAAFDPDQIQDWARGLGQDLFTGTTGRVFPRAMKASPLLRAWLARLDELGVARRTRWRWTGWDGPALTFDTPDGAQQLHADVTVLAMGGASWSRLGSDGAWAPLLAAQGVEITPFQAANAGVAINWSAHMQPHFGAPLKGVAFSAGKLTSRGEAILSRNGLEGGGIYSVSAGLRDGAPLLVDLVPDLSAEALQKRLTSKRAKSSLTHWLRGSLRLTMQKIALFHEMTAGQTLRPDDWVRMLKALPIVNAGLAPIDHAISTAGGVSFAAMTDQLMLRTRPGTFCAGEMLDWDAPTGGYLLSACFATGRWAGQGAVDWLAAQSG
ncbi:MAG: TIGR03862 family flavoprotein [Sedimentitalea sp.]